VFQGKQIADNSIPASKIIGGTGGGGTRVNFAFTSPSPMVLGVLPASALVNLSQIVIETPFDDPAAVVLFGLASDPSLFFGVGDSFPSVAGQFKSSISLGVSVTDILLLTIHPGTSTRGNGYLLYTMAP
jgi:hypothetical protein